MPPVAVRFGPVKATSPGLVRAFGVAAALAWVGLALLHRVAWQGLGPVVLGASVVLALALRPVSSFFPRALLAAPRVVFVAACALAAAGVSWWVLGRTLRGEPLSIDAGVYLMQARALAHGHFGMPAPLPSQAFGDRFLLEGPDGRLYGIFPPGWPLAIVPFVWLGRPMLVGPVVAALMVFAQAALGRALGQAAGEKDEGELATRVSLLLSLPSIARALETADLLSHAFVGLLACVAIACALRMRLRGGSRYAGLLLGACVGWVLAARLLDGVVLATAVAGVVVWRRADRRSMAWAWLGAAPFLLLLLFEQHTATGAWMLPTQTAYFQRSDWPATCHRLGFGPDVGCTVEHPGPVAKLGGDGYDVRDAFGVVRERAGSLGEELLGFAPLVLVAFAPLAISASAIDAVAVAFVLALTLAYGLFYYGNAMFFGARHLFPLAPFVWLLVARGAALMPYRRTAGWLDREHARGAAALVVLAVTVAGSRSIWRARNGEAAEFQSSRSDLPRTMAVHGFGRGILKSHDFTAVAAAFDPWSDGESRFYVLEDGSGLVELRRAHPELPVFLSLPDEQVGRLYPSRPAPGVLVELERAWPTFVRPSGLASRQASQEGASGGTVLLLSHASPGARLAIPFETAIPGDYELRVDGFAGPDEGEYDLVLDGAPLPSWRGYAPEVRPLRGEPTRRALDAGRHLLVAQCTGRDDASSDYDARLDVLVGQP